MLYLTIKGEVRGTHAVHILSLANHPIPLDRPLLPLSDHQKFIIFLKFLENSKKILRNHYHEFTNHEYLISYIV
jgi:hypothetical protein